MSGPPMTLLLLLLGKDCEIHARTCFLSDPQLLDKAETTGRSIEPESTAALALEMIHQTAQHGVLASTTGTMVDLLLMGWAAEMLIQAG